MGIYNWLTSIRESQIRTEHALGEIKTSVLGIANRLSAIEKQLEEPPATSLNLVAGSPEPK